MDNNNNPPNGYDQQPQQPYQQPPQYPQQDPYMQPQYPQPPYQQPQYPQPQQPYPQPYQQPYGQPPQYQAAYRPPPSQQGGVGLAVASMVLGILAVVFFCFTIFTLPLSVTGLILGGVSLAAKKGGTGMAVTGLVLSLISIGIVIYITVVSATALTSLGSCFSCLPGDFFSDFFNEFGDYM